MYFSCAVSKGTIALEGGVWKWFRRSQNVVSNALNMDRTACEIITLGGKRINNHYHHLCNQIVTCRRNNNRAQIQMKGMPFDFHRLILKFCSGIIFAGLLPGLPFYEAYLRLCPLCACIIIHVREIMKARTQAPPPPTATNILIIINKT